MRKWLLQSLLWLSVGVGSAYATSPTPFVTPGAPLLGASSYVLIDASNGKILASKNLDVKNPPASLTKLMSLYIISSALKNNQIRLDDKVHISAKAWKTGGSRMFVKVRDYFPLKTLLQGIIVASGNDATVALAEHLAGNEETFATLMNDTAKTLGMSDSHFIDSTGLPNKNHYSTARDLATLTRAYINTFPEDYGFYSEKWFTYNGIRQPNRNRLLWRYQYADGLKTGHTDEAGYCLVASAKKGNMRLISVVMGEPNDNARTEDSIRLFIYGFRFFETHKLYGATTPLIEARVWGGDRSTVPLGLAKDFYATLPAGQYKRIQITATMARNLKAPIVQGKPYGTLNVMFNNQVIDSQPLVALQSSQSGGWLRKTTDYIGYQLHHFLTPTNEKINTG